jgi:hypothetical protein
MCYEFVRPWACVDLHVWGQGRLDVPSTSSRLVAIAAAKCLARRSNPSHFEEPQALTFGPPCILKQREAPGLEEDDEKTDRHPTRWFKAIITRSSHVENSSAQEKEPSRRSVRNLGF